MVILFVRHDVADFDAWKQGYDANAHVRSNGGVLSDTVYRSVDDPNNITVMHHFDDEESAKAFTASPELKGAMAALGVTGAPEIWFTEQH
jgi:quinol monooxygenase YgiN